MSNGKHTPGPFTVRQPETWPFDIEVVNQDGEVMWSERRYAHASRQKTVDECMRAVGFDYDERPAIIEQLERQLCDVHIRAAAPDILAALRIARKWVVAAASDSNTALHALADIDAAIVKAEGKP